MRRQPLTPGIVVASLMWWYACVGCKPEAPATILTENRDSIPAPKVTVIAELPDSLQPHVTYLKDVPPPTTTVFSVPPPFREFVDTLTGQLFPPEAHGKGFFTNYTSDDGLAADGIHSSFMDRAGNLWFGSINAGVSRFDGKSFETFTTEHGLPSNSVWDINEDRSGNLLFATFGGLSLYDGKTFTNFTIAQGLPHNDVLNIQIDNAGNLWVSTMGGGVSRNDGQNFIYFNQKDGFTEDIVTCITKDSEGNLWFGTRSGKVFYYNFNSEEERVSFKDFEGQEHWANDWITFIFEDSKGRMWFGTDNEGLSSYDGKSFTNYSKRNGLYCGGVRTMIEDRDGTFWIGGCNALYRFDGRSFVEFSVEQGFTDNLVSSSIEDNMGGIWFTTYGKGVWRYNGKSFTNFVSEPINNNVVCIAEDRAGKLWFGSNHRGVAMYDGTGITSFSMHEGLALNVVNTIVEDKAGRLWFGTDGGGVSRLEPVISPSSPLDISQSQRSNISLTKGSKARFANFTTAQGLPHDRVYTMTEDRDGNLWLGTYGGGVVRFDGKSFTSFTTAQGLPSNEIYIVFDDTKGNLWITSLGFEGIALYNGKSFTHFTTDHGLAENMIGTIAEDRAGNIWFGSTAGLNLLSADKLSHIDDLESIEGPLFDTYDMRDGLPHQSVNQIFEDHLGNMIVGTAKGIAILKGGLSAFNTPGAIEVYSDENGDPLKDAFPVFEDDKGILWISSSSDKAGLARFDQNALFRHTDPPSVIIKSIKINHENLSWYGLLNSPGMELSDRAATPAWVTEEVLTFGRELNKGERDWMRTKFEGIRFDSVSSWYPLPVNLSLPYRYNNVTFDFNAVITDRNQLVRYQYILEGYSTDWSPVSESASADFGNIREGAYTFKVKARSPEGVWSDPVTYSFRVLPPLHRTWWAYSLYGVVIASLLYVIVRFQRQRAVRIERQRAQQKQAILNERLRISRDLHDEVGATLSGIAMYSHIAQQQLESKNTEASSSLDIIRNSSGEMVDKLNDIVWLLNPDHADLQKLIDRLEEYAKHMAKAKGMQVHVRIPDQINSRAFPIEHRRNIYLICKEAINNAVKYSGGTLLVLEVFHAEQKIVFHVEDNGAGFNVEKSGMGNGITNIRKRAEEIGATLEFLSDSESGTRIRITL